MCVSPVKDLRFRLPVGGRLVNMVRWHIDWVRWLSDCTVWLWGLLLGGHGPAVGWRGAAAAVHDYGWLIASKLLLPLSRSPGPFERRCFARALRCEPPLYALAVRHIDTAMVDGHTLLRGTLWLPKAAGPFPVVVVRSPYCLHTETEWGHIAIAERGYAVLLQVLSLQPLQPHPMHPLHPLHSLPPLQDTRGRLSSQGEFVPFEHERGDGAASVAWVRQQPWCGGRLAVLPG